MKIFLNWKFLSVRDEPDILLDIKFPNRLPSDHLNPAGYLIRNTGSRWIFGWISGILLGARAGFRSILSCFLVFKPKSTLDLTVQQLVLNNLVCEMALILEGNSEMGAHVRSNVHHARGTCSELPSNISTKVLYWFVTTLTELKSAFLRNCAKYFFVSLHFCIYIIIIIIIIM